jgi:hypothetical protein
VKIGGVTVSSTGGDIDPLNFVVSAGVNTAVSECVPTVDVDVIVNATVVVSWAGDGCPESPRASPRWPPTDEQPSPGDSDHRALAASRVKNLVLRTMQRRDARPTVRAHMLAVSESVVTNVSPRVSRASGDAVPRR